MRSEKRTGYVEESHFLYSTKEKQGAPMRTMLFSDKVKFGHGLPSKKELEANR